MAFRRTLVAVFFCICSLSAQQKPSSAPGAASKNSDDSQLYRNSAFGFRYRIPYGWVDRTKDLQDQQQKQGTTGSTASKGEVLLAVFERPPDAAGDTVNSAVVIAVESADSYPGLKRAEDYLGPLNELTIAKGFKPDGDPSVIVIDSRPLVCADFTKALNDKLTMYQSTLVLLEKKQILSFTFIGGDRDEVDDLIDEISFPSGTAGTKK